MNISINLKNEISNSASCAYIFTETEELKSILNADEFNYFLSQVEDKNELVIIDKLGVKTFLVKSPNEEDQFINNEKIRIKGFEILGHLKTSKTELIQVKSTNNSDDSILLLAEGIALSFYDFDKYKTDKKETKLEINIISSTLDSNEINNLNNLVNANHIARDFVNEPHSYLNTIQYAKDLEKFSKQFGVSYSKFEKSKIEELKMGGLLAVNQGSTNPPIFNIMEYKPKNAVNSKPIVFVGKGVVYDTGGLSLKPTPNSMDIMKCDMGGSAAVAGAIFAIAQNKLPVHVISLIAATDNWIGKDAYAPGDVITMYNGKTVEVLNTDAEGRLTLGDALTYADELNPELVIDLATLTGAAARAIGKEASVVMGNAPAEVMMMLQESGMKSYERLVEFPLFDEYKEDIKSAIADMKNLGGAEAGATTAGIFLQNFTTSPWIHIDIAGTAYILGKDKYRGIYGTGVGVRLLYQFVKDFYNVG